jgi:hypothetical protein
LTVDRIAALLTAAAGLSSAIAVLLAQALALIVLTQRMPMPRVALIGGLLMLTRFAQPATRIWSRPAALAA